MKPLQPTFSLFLALAWPFGAIAMPPSYVVFWGYVPESAPRPSTGIVAIGGRLLTNAVFVSAGQSFGLALRSDSTVAGWGFNRDGQATGAKLMVGDEITNGLVTIGVQKLTNIRGISAGSDFGLALRNDGAVAAWGNTNFGQLRVPVTLSNVTAIAAGGMNCLAINGNGTVVGWGSARVPDALNNVIAIATGGTSGGFGGPGGVGVALKDDGTVVSWDTRNGLTNTPTGLSNIVAIAASALHFLALKSDGNVISWGADSFGVTAIPAGLSKVKAIAAGNRFSLALKDDGTVTTWGFDPRHVLNAPIGLSNVVAIAAGDNFCLAITTNPAVADKFRQK